MILTLIQGHGMQESKTFYAKYLVKLLLDLDGIWNAVETYWSNESYAHLILSDLSSMEKVQLR